MSGDDKTRVKVECPECGRRLTIREANLGKKIKCPQCQTSFYTQAAEPIGSAQGEPAPPPPDEDDDLPPTTFDETLASKKKKKKKKRTVDAEPMHPGTALLLGTGLSLLGAALGAGIYFGLYVWLERDIRLPSLAIGFFAGLGMALFNRDKEDMGGFIAAGITVAAILGIKVIVFQHWIGVMSDSTAEVRAVADDDLKKQRAFLRDQLVEDMLDESEEDEAELRKRAARQVREMTDDAVRKRFLEERAKHDREVVADGMVNEILRERKIDPDDADDDDYEAAHAEAEKRLADMDPAALNAKALEIEQANKEADAKREAEMTDEDRADANRGWLMIFIFTSFGILETIFLLPAAIGTAFKLGCGAGD